MTIHAQRYPERIAYIDGVTAEERTFDELEQRTNALAGELSRAGVSPGERVALLTLNSIQALEVQLAVAKLGAIAVPINFRLSPREITYVLTDSGASTLFYSPAFAGLVEQAVTPETEVRHRYTVPDSTLRAAGGQADLEAMIARGDTERVVRAVAETDVCLIMYTSGTTGLPKGAMLTHANMLWNAVNGMSFGRGYTRQDITLTAAPLFHIGALGVNTLPFLYMGGTCVILEAFDPGACLSAIEKYKVSNVFLVPAMWAAIMAHPAFATTDWSTVTLAISGGAPCPMPIIETFRALGVPFTEGLGMTETSPICACLGEEDVTRKAGSIGKPVINVEFRIVDEQGRSVPDGEVGELIIRGPNIFAGYWNKPEATSEALRDGWFYSGDLARVDDDGFYSIVDRKKDMVITGGENVYSAEVEQAIIRHPDVREVAVVGKPDQVWGEAVTAFVARAQDSGLTEQELIDWLREHLAHFKCPKHIEFVEELPRNATGKILKRELRKQWDGEGSAVYRD
ncbi:acyl-CoA synthetase [Gephyromycinifex aptenodytis]|uniref:acyl-CoA synthetase n=1 Tax=Gephyromycinifex aptenodytis TaxID=2716227 RepID=UPI001B2FE68F|nr:long-chain fatty acid--CoA ligase [Gephyromycinifex aptenodytis]